jgi:hypothetical protein
VAVVDYASLLFSSSLAIFFLYEASFLIWLGCFRFVSPFFPPSSSTGDIIFYCFFVFVPSCAGTSSNPLPGSWNFFSPGDIFYARTPPRFLARAIFYCRMLLRVMGAMIGLRQERIMVVVVALLGCKCIVFTVVDLYSLREKK